MNNEYDFSKAERGRFDRPDAVLAPPVHLDSEVLAFFPVEAEAQGISLDELVNRLLKKGHRTHSSSQVGCPFRGEL